MILRKTPSAFLRTLRTLSPEQLPVLPTKKLSARQRKRLEDAVLDRIRAEENRTVFDADPTDRTPKRNEDFVFYDSPYEMTVIGGRGAWKHRLKTALAACLCFAVLTAAVLYGTKLLRLVTPGGLSDDTDLASAHGTETTAVLVETGVPYPGEDAEGFSLEIVQAGTHDKTGYLTLQVTLTFDGKPLEGIAIQYRRVILSLWDPDVRVWRAKYDVYTSNQPKEEIMAGDLHFSLNGQGLTTSADAVITIPRDIRDYTGVWGISLEGLTLVHNSSDPTDPENILVTEVLTDGAVHATFFSRAGAPSENADIASTRDTTTPPPDAAEMPLSASEDYALLLSRVTADGMYNTLDVVLDIPGGNPDGYAVYYRTEETELWNHEKQMWEGKHGTGFGGDDDTVFAKMLCAGEIHFTVDETSGATFDSIRVKLGDPGWYRTTLRGLVLVREAREGEEDDFSNLVCEELEAGAVSVIYHIE